MGDGTDRRQPLHHRVSSVKGVSMVLPFQGEDTVGCRAILSNLVQHPADLQEPRRTRYAEQRYVVQCICDQGCVAVISAILLGLRQHFAHYSERVLAFIGPHIVDHSPDKSHEGSSSYASGDAEPSQPTRQQYDVRSRNCRHRVHNLPNAEVRFACYGFPGAVVFTGHVLCEHNEQFANHT